MSRPIGRNSDFRKLWASQILSLAALQFGQLALPLIAVLTLHAGAGVVGLLGGLSMLPWLVFGPFIGPAIEGTRRRYALITAHLGRAALLAAVAIAALAHLLTVWQLCIASVALGTLGMCFEVAYHSYLPSIVPADQLATSNGRLAVTDGMTRIAGPSIAGIVVQALTATAAIGFQTLSFLLAAICVHRIRAAEPTPQHVKHASRDGWRYCWRHRLIRALTLAEATYLFFFGVAYAAVLVFYSRRLGLSPAVIGFIYSAGSVGGIVGAVAAPRLGRRFSAERTALLAAPIRGIGVAVIPLAAYAGPIAVPLLVLARLINATGWSVWDVHQQTLLQLSIPDSLRVRVTGSSLFAVRTADAIGSFVGAGLAAPLGVVPTLVVGGIGAVAAAAWLWPIRPAEGGRGRAGSGPGRPD